MFTMADAIMFLGVSAPVCIAIARIGIKRREDGLTWREFKLFREVNDKQFLALDSRLDAIAGDQQRIAKHLGIDLWGS